MAMTGKTGAESSGEVQEWGMGLNGPGGMARGLPREA